MSKVPPATPTPPPTPEEITEAKLILRAWIADLHRYRAESTVAA